MWVCKFLGEKKGKMNIFDLRDLSEKEEIIKILAENENIKIEKIISTGQITDWQVSEKNEFVILIQGEAEIEFFEKKNLKKNEKIIENKSRTKNKKLKLLKGDTVLINRMEKHRVSYTSKNPCCIWVCIFFN